MSTFDTKENKGLIWNIMNESGVFKGIPDSYLDQVKRDFETKITSIKRNIQPKDTLTLLNKRVLSEMMVEMAKYRLATIPSVVTSKDISTVRQQQFQNVLERKKEEFTNMLGNKPPSTIDFSDKMDRPIGSEIEDMIAATIARRNKDLNVVLENQDTVAAAKWLNAGSPNDSVSQSGTNASSAAAFGVGSAGSAGSANASNASNASNGMSPSGSANASIQLGGHGGSIPPILKIGKNTSIDNVIDINSTKQVRFTNEPPTTIANKDPEEDDEDISTFLSILNNKDVVPQHDIQTQSGGIDERLTRIEETQKEILELLKGALPLLNPVIEKMPLFKTVLGTANTQGEALQEKQIQEKQIQEKQIQEKQIQEKQIQEKQMEALPDQIQPLYTPSGDGV
jgi:hypothetical protein